MITIKPTMFTLASADNMGEMHVGSYTAAENAYRSIMDEGIVTMDLLRRVYFIEVIKEEVQRGGDTDWLDPEATNNETYKFLEDADEYLLEFCKRNLLAIADSTTSSYIIGAQIFMYNTGSRYVQTEIADYIDVFDMSCVYDRIALEFYGDSLGCRL